VFSFDVTEKVLARRKVEDASRIKDEFLATVSHELRTPLSAIMGWVSLLETRPRTEQMVQKAVEVIGRNARAQVRIIDDILDVARIIRGKLHIERQPTDLALIVNEAIEAVRSLAEPKKIQVNYVAEHTSLPMVGDAERLRQVVTNLLSNAIKFTPQGGAVSIKLEPVASEIIVSVEDTGIGITSELLPVIFERFRQGDSSTTRAYGGVGLGLAIVRHIVELHGGTVQAKSAGVGQGTTFIVCLPRVPPRPSTQTPAGRKLRMPTQNAAWLSPTALSGLRILFAEDDEDTREAVVAALASSGAEVQAVASAEQALSELDRRVPHVLITDISMPERDGFWLLTQVRAKNQVLPVIALTAHTRAEDEQRALQAGFTRHVAKPVEPHELIDQVRQVVSEPHKS
jgi:CheY-like chemotaxis protein/two-component sensor histidine kinase